MHARDDGAIDLEIAPALLEDAGPVVADNTGGQAGAHGDQAKASDGERLPAAQVGIPGGEVGLLHANESASLPAEFATVGKLSSQR